MILILLFLTAITVITVRLYRKVLRLPPGPFPLPLIGNAHQLAYQAWSRGGILPALDYYRKVLETWTDLSPYPPRFQKYGNAYTLWLGPKASVSITDFETSQEVFVKQGKKCYDRQLAPILKNVSGGFGLLNANGENWAEMRRFTLLTFRQMGVGTNIMEKRIMDELNGRCSEIDAQIARNGRTIVDVEFFDLTVGSVINSFLIGKRFEDEEEFLKIKKLFDESSETFNIFDLNVPVWFLKTFLPSRFKLTWDSRHQIMDHVMKGVEERIRDIESGAYEIDPKDPNDVVDAFLSKMKKEEEIAGGQHPYYNLKSLKLVLHDLWLAGQGTTATTLYVGFMKLVNHPRIIQNIQKELLDITENGARDLTLKDRPNTPYLNATIAEIQRHASILNVNFWRINHETIHFNDFQVDPGTMIAAQVGALHVNEELFKNPKEFDVEMFLKNPKLQQQIIPFGIGKRSCVGEQIAKSELYLVFGNILLRYNVKKHGPTPTNEDVYPYSSAKLPDVSGKLEFVKL